MCGVRTTVRGCEAGGAGEAAADACAGVGAGGDPARLQQGRHACLRRRLQPRREGPQRSAAGGVRGPEDGLRAVRAAGGAGGEEGGRRLRHPAGQPARRESGEVDPAYTSQRCPRCGHTERANRPTRDRFCCRRCGLAGPADVVAGVNVRDRARSVWVFVTMPVPPPV
ncbi:zinc ribbon domain-containing protein [Streptomyces sp. NPDC059697]|uniref:zinc ribbon domain-containing protein n=1 Tax=Streptomyces sp. NPDC059697 TaxID=3346912 RepID=UPI003699FD25